jgi:hypothetical protein
MKSRQKLASALRFRFLPLTPSPLSARRLPHRAAFAYLSACRRSRTRSQVPPSLLLPTQARSDAVAATPYLGARSREDCIASPSPCARTPRGSAVRAPAPRCPRIRRCRNSRSDSDTASASHLLPSLAAANRIPLRPPQFCHSTHSQSSDARKPCSIARASLPPPVRPPQAPCASQAAAHPYAATASWPFAR